MNTVLKDSTEVAVSKTFMLDVLRGLAAIYVFISHAKWLLWEGYSNGYKLHPNEYSFLEKIIVYFFSCFSWGHVAVMLFFVLSGFVIHYSSVMYYNKKHFFSVKVFLYKRIRRIYPPFLVALLLTFILDTIGRSYNFSIYDGNKSDLFHGNIFSDLSLKTLIGNLLMLQGVFTRVWGSNGPLWSIMYEWWFYILYIPFFYINIKNPINTAYVVLISFVLVSLTSAYVPYIVAKFVSYFFIWYMGVIIADIYMKRVFFEKKMYVLISFILGVILVMKIFQLNLFNKDIAISLVFCIIIYCSLIFYRKLNVFNKISFLSTFSYTLYVIHVPILVFVSGYILKHNDNKLPMNFAYLFPFFFIIVLLAWFIHFVVEKPFVKKNIGK